MNAKQKRIVRPMDLDSFPAEITKRRVRLKLTQEEFGAAVGYHHTAISQFERSLRAVPYPQMFHLAILALELLGPDAVREQLDGKA